MELVDEMEGIGKVYRESELVLDSVRYEVNVWQEMLAEGVPGLQRTDIRLPGLSVIDVAPLYEVKGLVLEIEGGQRFGFFFTNPDGTIAHCV